MELLEIKTYSIDLGNGYTKRIVNGECIVEPSVIADVESYFSDDVDVTTLQLSEGEAYFTGDDVGILGLKPISALGEHDMDRYETPEFKKMIFGFLAKDFKQDVTIERLVTGLPVQHFKAKGKFVEELLKGRTVVKVNDKDIIISIKNVSIIPQPIGTYLHLVAKKAVTPNKDLTLIVDCGHGTVDVTELKGKTIVKRAGNNEGAKEAYINIYNTLVEEFGSLKKLTILNIQNILLDGLLVSGSRINVRAKSEVQKILKKHFNSIFTFLQDNKFDLRSYDKVVFTGGIVHLYHDYFGERAEANSLVVEDGQTANARGYHEYGKAMIKK
ncbi:ParM/StbA family protein [Bacillus cereus]|uniref:ParM/StbA family protein n=1 Tax=Bacillus cereus TaxID=1396 RepID=UPI004042DDDF